MAPSSAGEWARWAAAGNDLQPVLDRLEPALGPQDLTGQQMAGVLAQIGRHFPVTASGGTGRTLGDLDDADYFAIFDADTRAAAADSAQNRREAEAARLTDDELFDRIFRPS